nr:reverse transcriptase domain-containing protein [Tanacetum cinerariifolium]
MPSNASQGMSVAETQEEPWTLFTDGSSCVDGSGAGLILTNPDGVEFTYTLRFQFAASNNEAEYEALIADLRIATQMGVKNIQANVDSKLVANHVLGTYVAKEDNMIKYLDITKGLVLVEVLETKSITGKEVTAVIEEEGPTWMTELVNYLKEGDGHLSRHLRCERGFCPEGDPWGAVLASPGSFVGFMTVVTRGVVFAITRSSQRGLYGSSRSPLYQVNLLDPAQRRKTPLVLPLERIPRLNSGALGVRNVRRDLWLFIRPFIAWLIVRPIAATLRSLEQVLIVWGLVLEEKSVGTQKGAQGQGFPDDDLNLLRGL